jgi:7-carboxy-7-deazaguanine synthase (Cx14CxxC type)
MSYSIKEIQYTLQGEGFHAGRPAVFVRFAGCNLWTGREEDRDSAACRFCDTDFVGTDGPGGGTYETAEDLCLKILSLWPVDAESGPYVVCTGGEPLLQLDDALVEMAHEYGFTVAIETNGTKRPPEGIDWICVSPKAVSELILKRGNELKFIYPQAELDPESFLDLPFEHFFIQPLDGEDIEENVESAVQYCLEHPQWRLSLQIHKLLNIP